MSTDDGEPFYQRYMCGWYGGGPYKKGKGGYAYTSLWDNLGKPTQFEGADGKTWYGANLALFDWVCHGQSDGDGSGWDPSGEPKPYSEFPTGEIDSAFSGETGIRCFCDNEPDFYDGTEEGPVATPPGARLFTLWWSEEDPDNTMRIRQLYGDELVEGSTCYSCGDDDAYVQLTPEVANWL